MNCDICGKDMTYDDQSDNFPNTIGICVAVNNSDYNANKDYRGHIQYQFGPYSIDKSYCACFECTLRAFGFIPGIQGESNE